MGLIIFPFPDHLLVQGCRTFCHPGRSVLRHMFCRLIFPDLRRKAAILVVYNEINETRGQILHDITMNYSASQRTGVSSTTQQCGNIISNAGWIASSQEWETSRSTRVYYHILEEGEGAKGEDLLKQQWEMLNCKRTKPLLPWNNILSSQFAPSLSLYTWQSTLI